MNDFAFMVDLDGTLLFLGTDHESVRSRLRNLYASYDLSIDPSGIFPSIEEVKRVFINDEKLLKGVLRSAYDILDEEEIKGAPNSALRECALELLNFLGRFDLALVSSNCREAALEAFKKLGIDRKIFSTMVMRNDVTNLKPSSDPILKAVQFLMGKAPHLKKFMFIGDHKNDILAVDNARKSLNIKNISVQIISVGGGATREGKLKDLNPDFYAQDLGEALKIVKGMMNES